MKWETTTDGYQANTCVGKIRLIRLREYQYTLFIGSRKIHHYYNDPLGCPPQYQAEHWLKTAADMIIGGQISWSAYDYRADTPLGDITIKGEVLPRSNKLYLNGKFLRKIQNIRAANSAIQSVARQLIAEID